MRTRAPDKSGEDFVVLLDGKLVGMVQEVDTDEGWVTMVDPVKLHTFIEDLKNSLMVPTHPQVDILQYLVKVSGRVEVMSRSDYRATTRCR